MTAPQSAPGEKRLVALFTDLLGIGGVQEAGRLTSRALAEIARSHGWSFEFLSLNDAPGLHAVPGCEAGVQVRGFARNKRRFVLAALRQAWSMRSSGIVLAGHPHLAPPAAWMRLMRPSLRTIVMSHGVEVWKPLTRQRRKALLAAERVLAPSTDTAAKLTGVQGVPFSKVLRVPWPMNPAFLQMALNPQTLPLPSGFPRGRIILTVGRWAADERYKGADELIRAIATLQPAIPEVQLVAVGSGDDLPRLRAIAAELHTENRVHFLEKLTNGEVAACYAHCELFALPSSGEGYGLVFLEAMAFGRAVVGVAAGGAMDIIREGETGFLAPPGDTESLVQALGKLLRDDLLRAKLGKAGLETVSREYGFDKFRSRLDEILSECAAGRA
jgi:phosphatidyl-myo-inositol dimannoside synthase